MHVYVGTLPDVLIEFSPVGTLGERSGKLSTLVVFVTYLGLAALVP